MFVQPRPAIPPPSAAHSRPHFNLPNGDAGDEGGRPSPGGKGGLSPTLEMSLGAGMKVLEAKRKLRASMEKKVTENKKKMSKSVRIRYEIFQFLEEPETRAGNWLATFRFWLVFFSAVLPLCGDTEVGNAAKMGEPLDDFIGCLFILEVILRLVVAPSPKRFFRNLYHLFDVLACLPFFVRLCCIGSDAGGCLESSGSFYSLVAALRPILRMLKVTRDVPGFTLLNEVMKRSAEGLGVPAFLVCLLISFFAAILYWIEEEEMTFIDVPEVIWFCIVTISTVGYGDVSPMTTTGRAFGVIFILIGLTAFAMPLGVISGNFAIVYEDKDEILMLRRVQGRLKTCGVGAEQLTRAFRQFDRSGDAKLDLCEFSNFLLEFNVSLAPERMQMLFSFFDEDKSGQIEFSEFMGKVFPDHKLDSSPVPESKSASNDDVMNAVLQIMSQCENMETKISDFTKSSEKRLSRLERSITPLETG